MANICSVNFNLQFKKSDVKNAFLLDFKEKIAVAEKQNEGVRIAESKWLFNAGAYNSGETSAEIYGSVKWCLDRDSMQEFTEYFKKMRVDSFTCDYEETGNQVYGRYSYEDKELWNCHLDECHSIWEKANSGEDDYFDELEYALDMEGTMEQVS